MALPFGVLTDEEWWRGLDSNQRRRSQRIYSPSPLTTRAPLRYTTGRSKGWNLLANGRPAGGAEFPVAAVMGTGRSSVNTGRPENRYGIWILPGPDDARR